MGSGEEAGTVLSDSQQAILTAVCDTVVPSLPRDRDPDGLWDRKASDIGVDVGAAQLISEIPDPELQGGLLQLIDALGGQGITRAPSQESREQILRNTALSDPRAAAGVAALINMTLFLHYGAPDPQTGQNPNWQAFALPGSSLRATAGREAAADPRAAGVRGDARGRRLHRGLRIGRRGRARPCWLPAVSMWSCWRRPATTTNRTSPSSSSRPTSRCSGGAGPTRPRTATSAWSPGTTLGGGTTINWTNCLRTRPWVREQWAGSTAWRGSTRRTSTVISTRYGLGSAPTDGLQRPERHPPAAARRHRGARLELRDDHSQHRRRQTYSPGDRRDISGSATSRGANGARTAPGSPTHRSTARGS